MIDYLEQHPWRQFIIAPISKEIDSIISDENPQWEYLDTEMVKLGSLEHELLNIEEMQKIALSLLSSESKDVRILAHLLRTLQHSGTILDLLLGLQLFTDYVECYWEKSAPISDIKKYRLGVQIIKRFDKASVPFQKMASRLEKEAAQRLFEKLAILLKNNKLETELLELSHNYLNYSDVTSEQNITPIQYNKDALEEKKVSEFVTIKPVEIDHSNERAWKNTLFKIVDYLVEKDVSAPIGYQLRRYIIWSNIISLPHSEENRTPLSPPSVDLISEYEKSLEQPSLLVWKEIEHSLTVSPYWFYGHYLSAHFAKKLGYNEVAESIKQDVNTFIERLPQLVEFRFNDNSVFCPPIVLDWLQQNTGKYIESETIEHLFDNIDNENLESILVRFNEISHQDLRDNFYHQISLAQVLEKKGFEYIAKQHYLSIYNAIKQFSIIEWEESLNKLLETKLHIK